MVQYRKATTYIVTTVLFFLLFIPFLGGNIIVYTPNQGKTRESTLFILFIKGKMPTLAGNKHPSIHFFLYGPRLFHPSTEKVRVRTVGIGHQSGYSRADTIHININKRSQIFPYREKTLEDNGKIIYSMEKKQSL